MATKQWTGQGGTNNANITTANSGGASGDAFDSITLAGAGTLTYSNTAPPLAGYMSARAQAAAGGSDRVRWYHTYTASNYISRRYAFRMRQDPAAGQVLADIVASDFGFAIQLQLATVSGARHLLLKNDAGTTVKDWGTITYGSATTDIYWLDLYVVKGTTTSNGTLKAKLYDDTQTLVGTEYSSTIDNTGTLQYIRTQWGGNAGVLMDMDVWAISANNDSPGAYVGLPTTSNTVPTASITTLFTDPVEPGTVAIVGTVSDSDGTVASATFSIVSGPNSPTISHSYSGLNTASCTVTGTFTAEPNAHYVLQLTGTDNAGGVVASPPTAAIDTYATTGDVEPYEEVSNAGSYTAVGAGTRLAAVTDASDSTYAESPSAPSGAVYRARYPAFRPNRDIKPSARLSTGPGGGATIDVVPKLYRADGTTLVATHSTVTVTDVPADFVFTFTNPGSLNTAALRKGLILELSGTQ